MVRLKFQWFVGGSFYILMVRISGMVLRIVTIEVGSAYTLVVRISVFTVH